MNQTHRHKRSFISSIGHIANSGAVPPKRSKPMKSGFFSRSSMNVRSISAIPPDIITGYRFQFTLKTSDKDDATYITFRGSLTDDGMYQIWRRVIGSDKKDIKMSPSWLYKQTSKISCGILVKLFKCLQTDLQNVSKKKLVSICYEKLGMTKANKKLKEKELMMFTDDEIQIIVGKIKTRANRCDLVTDLFNYFVSDEIFLKNENYMDVLDDLMSYKSYEDAVLDIYNALVEILISTKT
eukprot:301410_1